MTEEEFEKLSDLSQSLKDQLEDLDDLSSSFSNKLSKGLSDILIKGKDVDDVLRNIALSLSQQVLKQALNPVGDLLSSGINSVFKGFGSSLSGGFSGGASGALSGGLDLGSIGASAYTKQAVNVTINAQDAESFLKSEAQVTSALARAVNRGGRSL